MVWEIDSANDSHETIEKSFEPFHAGPSRESGIRLERDSISSHLSDKCVDSLSRYLAVLVLLAALAIAVWSYQMQPARLPDPSDPFLELTLSADLDAIPESVRNRLTRELGIKEIRMNDIIYDPRRESSFQLLAGRRWSRFNAYVFVGDRLVPSDSGRGWDFVGTEVLLAVRLKDRHPSTMIWQRFLSTEYVHGLSRESNDDVIRFNLLFQNRERAPVSISVIDQRLHLDGKTEFFDYWYD